MKQMKHWQDPANALLGAWLVVSPWVIDIQDNRMATINFVVVGLLLVAAAVGAILLPRAWEEWAGAALGVWLVASPWILGFASISAAVQVALITGLVAIVLTFWVLATDKEFGDWMHRRAG